MRYPPTKIITPPATDPFVFSLAKQAMRVDHDADDEMVMTALQAAVTLLEDETGRAFITQTVEAYYSCWPSCRFLIPKAKLQSVTSITYRTSDGASVVWDPSNYVVDTEHEPGRVFLAEGKTWPTDSLYVVNPITIRFVCGFGALASIPPVLTRAIYWQAQHNYDFRNPILFGAGIATKALERGVAALVANLRVAFADEFSNPS